MCGGAQPKDAGIDLAAVQGVLLADMALQNGAPGRDLSPATKRFRQAVFKTTFKKNKVQVRNSTSKLNYLLHLPLLKLNAGSHVFVLRTRVNSNAVIWSCWDFARASADSINVRSNGVSVDIAAETPAHRVR